LPNAVKVGLSGYLHAAEGKKHIRGKTQPLSSAALHALRDEYSSTIKREARRKNADCRIMRAHSETVANHPAPVADPAACLDK